ncbi:O-antigen ligase family protein [Schleiferiaceae bacterium]|nr:O-antigen ligase family protein [Schleiferiaceae bacterium]
MREDVTEFIGYTFDYLTLGFHLGLLSILLNFQRRSLYIQLFVLGLLFASSARGPFLFTLFALIIMNHRKRLSLTSSALSKMRNITLVIVGIISSQIEVIWPLIKNATQRFESLFSGNDYSAADRVDMMSYALYQPFQKLSTFLVGNGIGSFGVNYIGLDVRSYPHNIFLEVFFELGILGLLLIISHYIFIFSLKHLRNNVFAYLLLFALLNSLKSSNLTDLWVLYSLMGLGTFVMRKDTLKYDYNY